MGKQEVSGTDQIDYLVKSTDYNTYTSYWLYTRNYREIEPDIIIKHIKGKYICIKGFELLNLEPPRPTLNGSWEAYLRREWSLKDDGCYSKKYPYYRLK